MKICNKKAKQQVEKFRKNDKLQIVTLLGKKCNVIKIQKVT